MASLHVTLHSGESRTIAAADGVSVMQAIRDADTDELLALCGGCSAVVTRNIPAIVSADRYRRAGRNGAGVAAEG